MAQVASHHQDQDQRASIHPEAAQAMEPGMITRAAVVKQLAILVAAAQHLATTAKA